MQLARLTNGSVRYRARSAFASRYRAGATHADQGAGLACQERAGHETKICVIREHRWCQIFEPSREGPPKGAKVAIHHCPTLQVAQANAARHGHRVRCGHSFLFIISSRIYVHI